MWKTLKLVQLTILILILIILIILSNDSAIIWYSFYMGFQRCRNLPDFGGSRLRNCIVCQQPQLGLKEILWEGKTLLAGSSENCKYLVTSIYKPFKCYLQGEQAQLGDVLTKVLNHLLIGMILQVLGPSHSKTSKETQKLTWIWSNHGDLTGPKSPQFR